MAKNIIKKSKKSPKNDLKRKFGKSLVELSLKSKNGISVSGVSIPRKIGNNEDSFFALHFKNGTIVGVFDGMGHKLID